MKSQKKPTLKDIAKLAGISVNSASRALKQKKNISLKTQEKVRKIADKLGYIPDMRASALRAGKMVIRDGRFVLPISTSLKASIEGVIHDVSDSGQTTFIEPTIEAKTIIDNSKTPIVLLGRNGVNTNTTSIYSDDYEGGKLAAQTFINLGLKNLLYYTEHKDLDIDNIRHKGFEDCVCASFNKKPLVVIGDEENKAKDLLKIQLNNNHVDGIFCFSDLLAFDVLEVLYDLNLTNKVKVIGYDNIQKSFRYPIRVSSIAPDNEKIVTETITTILDMIENKNYELKLIKINVAFYQGTTC